MPRRLTSKRDAFTCLLAYSCKRHEHTETNDSAMIGHEGETQNPRSDVSGIALSISRFAHGIIIRTRNIELRGSSDRCARMLRASVRGLRTHTWPKTSSTQLYLARHARLHSNAHSTHFDVACN